MDCEWDQLSDNKLIFPSSSFHIYLELEPFLFCFNCYRNNYSLIIIYSDFIIPIAQS